jgi:hypothetical protein
VARAAERHSGQTVYQWLRGASPREVEHRVAGPEVQRRVEAGVWQERKKQVDYRAVVGEAAEAAVLRR